MEIPDSVKGEQEKEQEENVGQNTRMTGMTEEEAVTEILNHLVEDDEDLFAEMGDFNILEYADPELNSLTEREKRNIMDKIEAVEKHNTDNRNSARDPISPDKELGQMHVLNPNSSTMVNNPSALGNQDGKPLATVRSDKANSFPIQSQQSPMDLSTQQQQPQQQQQQQQPSSVAQPQHVCQQQQLLQTHQQLPQNQENSRSLLPIVKTSGNVSVSCPNVFPTSNMNQESAGPLLQQISASDQQQQRHLPKKRLQHSGRGVKTNGQIVTSNDEILTAAGGQLVAAKQLTPLPSQQFPPYQGPPPPYPNAIQPQQPQVPQQIPMVRPVTPQNTMQPPQTRPLMLQEQPFFLKEVLEQKKQEKENRQANPAADGTISVASSSSPLLSAADMERLQANILNLINNTVSSSLPRVMNAQQMLPTPSLTPTPVNANMQGAMQTYLEKNIQGNLQESLQRNVEENIQRNLQENIQTNIQTSRNLRQRFSGPQWPTQETLQHRHLIHQTQLYVPSKPQNPEIKTKNRPYNQLTQAASQENSTTFWAQAAGKNIQQAPPTATLAPPLATTISSTKKKPRWQLLELVNLMQETILSEDGWEKEDESQGPEPRIANDVGISNWGHPPQQGQKPNGIKAITKNVQGVNAPDLSNRCDAVQYETTQQQFPQQRPFNDPVAEPIQEAMEID